MDSYIRYITIAEDVYLIKYICYYYRLQVLTHQRHVVYVPDYQVRVNTP